MATKNTVLIKAWEKTEGSHYYVGYHYFPTIELARKWFKDNILNYGECNHYKNTNNHEHYIELKNAEYKEVK